MIYRYIILSSIKKIQSERSVSAVYYILQGKHSIQTIQDAHLFGLSHYYRIYKLLDKSSFMREVNAIEGDGYLNQTSKQGYYTLTDQANIWLQQHDDIKEDFYVNGMLFHQVDTVYFERLLLLIQVWANRFKQEQTYIPIIETPQVRNWVKTYYQRTKTQVPIHLQKLYNEFVSIFKSIKPIYVEIFTLQLTSYKQYGLAAVQIAELYHIRIEDVHLITMSVIHHILHCTQKTSPQFELLYQLREDLTESVTLTESATKTNALLQQNLSLEQIALKRQLKLNTIYDHVVEIAIEEEDFPLEKYITNEDKEKITTAILQVDSYTLKEIKSLVDDSISYFQIRLVLANWNKYMKQG